MRITTIIGLLAVSTVAYAAAPKPTQNLSTQALVAGKGAVLSETTGPLPAQPRPKATPVSAPARATFWNRPEVKAALSAKLTVGPLDGKAATAHVALKLPAPPPAPAAGACEAVKFTESPDCGCASYLMPDQTAVSGTNNWYYQPLHAFGDEQSSRNFAATVTASLPLVYPFHDPSVHPVQGWFYSNGNFHGAVDFTKSADQYGPGRDPSFPVHAAADGKVMAVFWDSWSGNIVIIEHTAPSGQKYRTSYFHLRNGFTHDLQQAKQTTPGSDPNANPARYRKFADLPNPSALLWGSDAQKILVKAGDTVKRGQQIAWSGNTGPGGAGSGLNVNGTPADPNTGNNHLHLMTAVPHPTQAGSWVQVDPFGVYGPLSNAHGDNCYDLAAGPAYVRLFAPFPPSFHNLPIDTFLEYWGYYTGMGMVLETQSVHKRGAEVLTSGSFQWGIPNDWYVYLYLKQADAQQKFDAFFKTGYRPREISVALDSSGNPRFSMIWKKLTGETFYTYFDLSDADWLSKWNDLVVKQKYRVEDHFVWGAGGQAHHAASFVKDGSSDFYELHSLSAADFQTHFDDYFKKGYQLVDFNAAEVPGKATTFGGIWAKRPGAFLTHFGVSATDYQNFFWDLSLQGYRLLKIQGYENSTRFGAIWTR